MIEVDKVCLANLGLQSFFRQVDIELNQRLITVSLGSYYLYKGYLDVVLSSNVKDTKGILKNELFHKDSSVPNLKAFNIEKGSYGWFANDVYHWSIPSEIKIVLCSGSASNGNNTENMFNFKNYLLNFAEVMVDGVSIPSQAITPNYTNGDFSEAYWTLMCEEPRYSRCIEMKEYPNGYCIYVFRIFGRVGRDVVNGRKYRHTRMNLKFVKALPENATVLLYTSFLAKIKVDAARNIL